MGSTVTTRALWLCNGEQTRNVPTKWNSLTTTSGVGWDFSLHRTASLEATRAAADRQYDVPVPASDARV